jgi:hypothetical protein
VQQQQSNKTRVACLQNCEGLLVRKQIENYSCSEWNCIALVVAGTNVLRGKGYASTTMAAFRLQQELLVVLLVLLVVLMRTTSLRLRRVRISSLSNHMLQQRSVARNVRLVPGK